MNTSVSAFAQYRFLKRKPLLLVSLLIFSVCLASPALGARVMLEWDQVSNSDVDGYRVYYGTSSRDYTKPIEISDPGKTQVTVENLDMETTYYFAVVSYKGTRESDYSREVRHTPTDSDGDGLSDYDETHFYPTDPGVADTDEDGIDDGAEVAYWNSRDGHSWDGDIDRDGTVNLVDPDSNDDGIQDGTKFVDPNTRTVVLGDSLDADYSASVRDTFINADNETNEESTTLNTYTWPKNEPANAAILKFDLSYIPEAAFIHSAELKLYQTDAGGDATYDVSAHRVINHDPVLAESTGYTYDGSSSWTDNDVRQQKDDNAPLAQADIAKAEDTLSLDQSSGYKGWNVTQMVQAWVNNTESNYGVLLNSDDAASQDSHRYFASSDAPDGTVRPMLVVEFSSSNDSDNDGLTDYEEKNTYHTDPEVADTDGDGIDDGTEVAYWKDMHGHSWDGDIDGDGVNNLLDPDADGDGYDDGTEYAASTDPADDSSHPEPKAPKAVAGVDQTVAPGSEVVLDASNSFDPDQDIASYSWKKVDGPELTFLKNTDSVRARFTASEFTSDDVGSYAFELTVEDSNGNSDTDTCLVNVAENATDVPSVAINASESGVLQPGANLTLSTSQDGQDSYKWKQLSGPDVGLADTGDSSITITVPEISKNGTSLTFSLTVQDSGLRSSARKIVNVAKASIDSSSPTADAGQDTKVSEGETVMLNGWKSSDDTGIASFTWRQVSGPQVTLSRPRSAFPYFVAPNVKEDSTLQFRLTAKNDNGLKDADTVTVTVQAQDNQDVIFNLNVNEDEAIVLPGDTLQNSHMAIQPDESSSVTSFEAKDPSKNTNNRNKPERISFKLFDYEIKVSKPGATAEVTFFFDTKIPEGHDWFKYSQDTGWQQFPGASQISSDRMSSTLTLTDGGPEDRDGEENGVIVDPTALGYTANAQSDDSLDEEADNDSSNGGGGGGGCIYTPDSGLGWSWLILLMALIVTRRFHVAHKQ